MKLTTPMSCSRHASTTFSSRPALSAWVALCSRWLVEAKRCLKKSMSVGFSGIFGSRGSAPMRKCLPGFCAISWAPLTMSVCPSASVNRTDLVAILSLSSSIICSSSSSACSDRVSGRDVLRAVPFDAPGVPFPKFANPRGDARAMRLIVRPRPVYTESKSGETDPTRFWSGTRRASMTGDPGS